MPRNSSGTYTLPSGNPVVSGTLIEASWANSTLSDLASAMTNSLSRGGEGGMTAALRLFDGTVSLPGLAFTSETSTGLYRAGSGDMRLAVTGSQVMQFLATGVAVTGTLGASGNFAINTDKFTVAASSGNTVVAGTLGVTGNLAVNTDKFTVAAASGNTAVAGTLAVTGASTFSGQTNTFENSTAYYPQLINRNKTADANGSYIVLDKIRNASVVQNGDVLGNLVFRGYDGTQYLQGAYINAVISATPGTNDMPTDLAFGTTPDNAASPSERMRITQAGNVGIGTSLPDIFSRSPGKVLGVSAASGSGFVQIAGASGSASGIDLGNGTTRNFTIDQDGSGNVRQNVIGSNYIWWGTNATERMRIDSSGNVGIGTSSVTNPQGWGRVVQITNSGSSALYLNDGTANWSMAAYAGKFWITKDATTPAVIDTSGNLLVGYTTSNGAYKLQVNSQIFATSSTIATSDARYKENITSLDGALELVKQLNPVQFSWKDHPVHNFDKNQPTVGFIAQEVQQVLNGKPYVNSIVKRNECVIQAEEKDQEGNVTKQAVTEEFFGIAEGNMIALLTKAIQEQQALITTLTDRITALEAAR